MRTFPLAPLKLPDGTEDAFRLALQHKLEELAGRLRGPGRQVELDVDQQTLDVNVLIDDFEPGRRRMPRVQVRFLIDSSQPRWTVLAGLHSEAMIRNVAGRFWIWSDDAAEVQLLEDHVCECIKITFP
jgi:hypothetical protein